MERHVSSSQHDENGECASNITSLAALLEASDLSPDDVRALQAAVRLVWQETESSLQHDPEYWERLSSDMFDRYDTFDQLADDWEQRYYHERGLVSGHGRSKGITLPKERQVQRRTWIDADSEPLVARIPPEPAATPHSQATAQTSAPAAVRPLAAPPLPLRDPNGLPEYSPKAILQIIDQYDAKMRSSGSALRAPNVSQSDLLQLISGYSAMMSELRHQRLCDRYGDPTGASRPPIRFGEDVPLYFANVGGESIYRRKELSVAGLCNLLYYGPIIFSQLQQRHFAGNPSLYDGDVGLTLMRRVTGNVVDLDTTVLRCNDAPTLNVINMSNRHKGLPEYSSAEEFADSKQAEEIAVSCATRLLDEFNGQFRLTIAQQNERKTNPSQIQLPIPTANDNSTRGHTPLWHYVNCGQNSFHVNVPTMEDVVGALLKAPFHCLRSFAFLHSGVYDTNELPAKLDEFFERCVVDSCFNMKWKSIEEYAEALRAEGSIVFVLQRLQQRNQTVFSAELFERDDPKTRDLEIAEMWRLVQAESAFGRDPSSGAIRRITLSDVATWVRST